MILGKVDQYLSDLFSLEDELLKQAETSIIENGMLEHSVSTNQGQFLLLLAKMCNAQHIIEIDPHFAEVARKNVEKAGLSDRIKLW